MLTVTFYAGKLLSLVLSPCNLLVLLALAGLLGGRRRWARPLLTVGVGGLVLVTVLPVGIWLLLPLENRFPPPAGWPSRVDGIIVLGGGVEPDITVARDSVTLNEAGERQTAMLALAKRYPEARMVFAGGNGQLGGGAASEAEVIGRLLAEQGVPAGRVLLEGRSRTTYENALLGRELALPEPGERWLLVTSAAHMPRAVGIFRSRGWPVEAWPVDYRTTGGLQLDLGIHLDQRIARLEDAAHEWSGLLWYRLLGRTDALLPAPDRLPAPGG